jgi:hypothetical protein
LKKASIILLALLLLVAGCSQNAALLKEPLKNSLDVTSYEGLTTVNLDTNLQTGDEALDFLLQVLSEGLIVRTQQKNMVEGHVSLSLQNPSTVVDSVYWPHSTEPSFEFYSIEDQMVFKSSIDEKFLGLSNVTPETEIDQDEFYDVLKQTFSDYIDQYNFAFKNVENLGEKVVGLEDGTSVETTHLQISIDSEEAIQVLIYTLENLYDFEGLETLINDMVQMSAIDAPGLSTEMNIEDVKAGLLEITTELKSINIAEFKEQGFDGSLVLDFWVGPEQLIVQQGAKISLSLPGDMMPEFELETIDFTLDTLSQNWNYNGDISFEIPQEDQVVTEEKLLENQELLEHFPLESPVRSIAEFLVMPELEFEPEQAFDDVTPEYWAFEEITTLKEFGIVEGTGNNKYKPTHNVTRAEFIKMMVTFNGIEPTNVELEFTDKDQIPSWATEHVGAAVQAGLIEGNGDGTLRPNQNISRAEMVTILVRGLELPLEEEYQFTYEDADTIPQWAESYVKTASSIGLVQGRQQNQFAPHESASRAEAATILYRVIFDIHDN